MTLSRLIETLQDLADSTEGDPEVRIAMQPSWPLRFHVSNVRLLVGDGDEDAEYDAEYTGQVSRATLDFPGEGEEEGTVCWIAASEGHPYNESPYAPKAAWDEGW